MLEKHSIREVFGNLIVLRDLEFRGGNYPGLGALSDKVGIPKGIIPRKSEATYAKIVDSMLSQIIPHECRTVVYVGDTYINDGRVIWNLSAQKKRWIRGFICREAPTQQPSDFLLGSIILSNKWSSIWKLVREVIASGNEIGSGLVGLFDLDQTVYAAKGRNDEALKRARLEAVHALVYDIVGETVYDHDKVERLYREFDQDQYHILTGDNQDFVVILTLASVLGLSSIQEVKDKIAKGDPSIISFVADFRAGLDKRGARTGLPKAWEFAQEVYFNLGADDRTPCKSFRRKEYRTTAKRMSLTVIERGNDLNFESTEHIGLNRPVLEFADFLKKRGATVIALSDRPSEATEPSKALDEQGPSLLDIKMAIYGDSIAGKLESSIV